MKEVKEGKLLIRPGHYRKGHKGETEGKFTEDTIFWNAMIEYLFLPKIWCWDLDFRGDGTNEWNFWETNTW